MLKNTFARSLVAGITLFVAAVAFADPAPPLSRDQLLSEQQPGRSTSELERWQVAPPEPAAGVTSGLVFDLPAQAVTPSATVKVAISIGARVYVEETIVLPAEIEAAPTISFLANHPRQLDRIRKVATSRPDAVRLTVTVGGNPVIDVPFAVADSGSNRPANGSPIVGSSDSVLERLGEPRKLSMSDPCEDACEQTFYECYLNCDERGAGCPWCATQYYDCLWYCNH